MNLETFSKSGMFSGTGGLLRVIAKLAKGLNPLSYVSSGADADLILATTLKTLFRKVELVCHA